jgi:hypothetical protein
LKFQRDHNEHSFKRLVGLHFHHREERVIDQNSVYTIAEAAERMRLPYRVVRDAVFAGRWPHVKVSERRRLMTGADISASLELMHQAPSATEKVDQKERKARIKRLLAA